MRDLSRLFALLALTSAIVACGAGGRGDTGPSGAAPSSPAPMQGLLAQTASVVNGLATFPNTRASYAIHRTPTSITVVDLVDGTVSTDVTGAQSLKFSDMTVNLGVLAQSQAISPADLKTLVELYVAFFNRVPDADGLSFWIGQFKAGVTLNQIADSFYKAGVQFSSLTGYSASMTNADFVTIVYRNVLGRSSVDPGGMAYWTTKLADGSETRGSLVRAILGSAHTFKGDATFGFVADLLDNKYTVASYFAIAQGLNFNTPEESITRTVAIAAAVTPTDTTAAIRLIGLTVDIRMFSVSQFGQGSVVNKSGIAVCSSKTYCSSEYAKGTAITVTAVPAAGWVLHHWSGCDTQSGDVCKVTLDVDKTVHPWFAPTTPPVLQPEAVELTALTMLQLVSNKGGVLIFGSSASQIGSLTAGSVIFSKVGEGLLRRVASVISLPGGSYIVDTTEATLADVIAEGTLIIDGRAGSSAAAAENPQASTMMLIELTLTGPEGTKDGFSAKATLDVTPEAAFTFGLTGLQEAKYTINPSLTLSEMSMYLKDEVFVLKGTLPLAKFPPVFAGPVVFIPYVEGKSELIVSVKVGVTGNGSTYLSAPVGMRWTPESGLTATGSLNAGGTFSFGDTAASASGKADFFLPLSAGLRAYGKLGLSLDIGPYLKVEGFDTVSAKEACIHWSATVGGRAEAVASDFAFLGLSKLKLTIADISRPLGGGSLTTCADTVPPSRPFAVIVETLSSSQLRVSWTAATDNVAVVGYTVTRNSSRLQDVGSVSFVDGGLQPDTQYCYTIIANDKAGNHSPPTSSVCGRTAAASKIAPAAPTGLSAQAASTTSIKLSWTAPADPAGISGYIILLGDKQVAQVDGTTALMPKLQPNTQYCYRVAAIDSHGIVGTPSAQVCATTLANAAWNMKIKCVGADYYVVQKDVDLDIGADQTLSVVGKATDYNGGPLGYQLVGDYGAAQSTLAASINWTSANSNFVRADEFTVRLDVPDTGDVTMNQVKKGGCNAQIRFVRNTGATSVVPTARPMSSYRGMSIFGE